MSGTILPYKITAAGRDAKAFHIDLSWTVVNGNDTPVWIDSTITIVHRRGLRTPFRADDEAWFRYHPALGIGLDFSQNRIADEWRAGWVGPWDVTKHLMTGEWAAVWNFPDWPEGVTIELAAKSSISATGRTLQAGIAGPRPQGQPDTAQLLLMPNSRTIYRPRITLPGPGASPGMREFWSRYDTPDFDIHWEIWQLPYQANIRPTPGTEGKTVAQRELDDVVEFDLSEPIFAGEDTEY